MPAPERLERDATILRRFTMADAQTIANLVRDNLDHLADWMPWANEKSTNVSFQRQRLESVLAGYETDDGFWEYCICGRDGAPVGNCAVVVRDDGRREIGYWVAKARTGEGHATRAAGLLTDAWRELRTEPRIEIRCDEANLASASVPRKLGYRLDRVIDVEKEAPAETGRMMVWVMDR
jgi:RimJ/RimL family protein N-acetyltransferase